MALEDITQKGNVKTKGKWSFPEGNSTASHWSKNSALSWISLGSITAMEIDRMENGKTCTFYEYYIPCEWFRNRL